MSYFGRKRVYTPDIRVSEELLSQLRFKLDEGTVHLAYGDWGVTFARDLLAKANHGQRLFSSKQASWVQKLADSKAPAPLPPTPVNVSGILALFETASKNLKFPKVRLQTASGSPVVLSKAGARSRNPGWINISDGGPFGANRWYGKINPDTGEWVFPRNSPEDEVQAVVFELSEDPAGVAAKYGKITGNCCFCAKGLTDDRSLKEGYGPICSKKWGLPWG